MRKMPKDASERKKGGSGYRGLRDRLIEEVRDPAIGWWFIGTAPKGYAPSVSWKVQPGVTALAAILAAKTIVGVCDDRIALIPAGKLARANSLDLNNVVWLTLDEAAMSFDSKRDKIVIAGGAFDILDGYEFQAVQVAAAAGAEMPDWFVPG